MPSRKSKPNTGFRIESPIKNVGTMLPEVTVSGGKAGKSNAELDRKAAIEYQGSGEQRMRGRSPQANMHAFNLLSEEQKNVYRAKAQERDAALNNDSALNYKYKK
tara:strand:+ start:351 stop:665 length:315 start_codon:yes stop_codon:yes gene_type:complete